MDVSKVIGPEVDEQLAIKRAMQVANPAMRLERIFRERHRSLVLSPFFVRETLTP
jgi:hypothetical protein